MKRIIAAFLLLAFTFVACKQSDVTQTNSYVSSDIQTETSLTGSTTSKTEDVLNNSTVSQIESSGSDSSYTQPETSHDALSTYIYTGGGFLPISYITDGNQHFSGEISLLNNWPQMPDPESLPKIDTSDMYIGDSVAEYLCYNSHEAVMNVLASNGDWDFFPTKVRYEKYSLTNQPDCDEWTAYFQKQLDEVSANAPIIFTQACFFEIAEQGTKVAIVNAGNTFEVGIDTDFFSGYDMPTDPMSPPFDTTARYQMSAIFIYQDEQVTTYELLNNIELVSESEGENEYAPLDKWHSLDYYSVQKTGDELTIYPIYASHVTWQSMHQYTFNYTYVLSDIDGDGTSELIVHWPVHYGFLQILRIDNGKVEIVATISTL